MGFTNLIRTTILLTVLTLLFLLLGRLIAGTSGMIVALVLALVINLGAYWFSDRLALNMAGAHEVSPSEAPDLYGIVVALAERSGIPTPKVYVIESPTPNAFATGRNPAHAAVAVTTGIVRLLDREELAGVIAHELAHIRNRDTLLSAIAAAIAGAITMLADLAQWSLLFGAGHADGEEEDSPSGFFSMLLMLILAPIAALLIQLAISRTREYHADATGARLLGNPLPLARALERLEAANQTLPMEVNPSLAHQFTVQPFRGNGLLTLFSTHPPIAERVARLRSLALQPAFAWHPALAR